MNRTLLNVLIDIAAASLFLAMIATGYILRFPLPPGTNKSAALWGLTRHEWGTIHSWISFALLGVIFLHVVLHWQWIVSVIGKRLRLTSKAHPGLLRSGIIVASILGLVFGLFAWAAQQSVKAITEVIPGVCPPEDLFQTPTRSVAIPTDERRIATSLYGTTLKQSLRRIVYLATVRAGSLVIFALIGTTTFSKLTCRWWCRARVPKARLSTSFPGGEGI